MKKFKKFFKSDSQDESQSTSTDQSTSASVPDVPQRVILTTNYGNITIALYADKTPRVPPPPSLSHPIPTQLS
jgi:hypothetical protein